MKQPVVYILASKPYGTLYAGVTSKLAERIEAHRNGLVNGKTSVRRSSNFETGSPPSRGRLLQTFPSCYTKV